jgi:hypothetical protein
MPPTWPDFDIYTHGTRIMRNGKLAVVWKAETETPDGQVYQLFGPLKNDPSMTRGGWCNDVDAAQEIIERRLSKAIPA